MVSSAPQFPFDFGPALRREVKYDTFSADISRDQLITASNASIDYLLGLLEGMSDADVVFDPVDEEAHDPYAVAGEETIGWSMAHLIAHVTASSEEGAAFGSLLARGVPVGGRLRYETPWRDITTVEMCRQRLEESRRMRLAYLDTWPDTPQLDVYREMSERFEAAFGRMNAVGAFLFGLAHEVGHYEQLADVRRQALAARSVVEGS